MKALLVWMLAVSFRLQAEVGPVNYVKVHKNWWSGKSNWPILLKIRSSSSSKRMLLAWSKSQTTVRRLLVG